MMDGEVQDTRSGVSNDGRVSRWMVGERFGRVVSAILGRNNQAGVNVVLVKAVPGGAIWMIVEW
jgi:hypothetical protein